MAHIMRIVYTLWLKQKLEYYKRSKNIAFDLSKNRQPKIGITDRAIYWWSKYCCCGFLKASFRANLDNKYVMKLLVKYNDLTTSGTFANYVATAIAGFLGGVVITYFYFIFFTSIFDLSISSTFYISVVLCFCLTIGLAFVQSVRCTVLSIIPELCTRKARNMLVSYALLLLITGPGANILNNTKQLTQTITCTREQLNAVSRNLTELYLKPMRALRNGITKLIDNIRPVVEKLKSGIIAIRNTIQALVDTVRKAFHWLGAMTSMCNNKIGTPYELCHRMFENLIQDCKVKVYPPFDLLCDIGVIVEHGCGIVKIFDVFCTFISFIKNDIFDIVQDKLRDVGRFIKTIFYVSISFHHSFAFETNQSESVKDVIKNVFHAEENRLHYFHGILNFMRLILGAYIGFILFTTFVYRQRFFRHLYYDNYHINRFIIDLDTRRASANRQTLFPLTYGEQMTYVSLFSLRLTIKEHVNFLKDSFFLLLSAIKVLFLLLVDVALHWILLLISTHGRLSFHFGSDQALVEAQGSGLWHLLYTFVNKMLRPMDLELRFDTQGCLPEPIPPAYQLYERVAYIMSFAWLMVLFQPFGLRFRNHVMSNYYPEAARRRAIWLYNYILQTRGNLSMYVRRQVFRKVSFGVRTDKPNLRKWLLRRFPWLGFILPYKDLWKECMVCGYTNPKIKCATPDCPGTYCKDCFEQQLGSKCLICNMPQNFKGMDVSEEEDSEEDEETATDVNKPWWQSWVLSPQIKGEEFSLRNMEDATSQSFSLEQTLRERIKQLRTDDSQGKDYFDGSWRRDDWAVAGEFDISMPDFGSWIRPELRDRENKRLF